MNIMSDNYNIVKFTNEENNIIMVYNPDTGEVDFESKLNTTLEETLDIYLDFFNSIKDSMSPEEPLTNNNVIQQENPPITVESLTSLVSQLLQNQNNNQPEVVASEPIKSQFPVLNDNPQEPKLTISNKVQKPMQRPHNIINKTKIN